MTLEQKQQIQAYYQEGKNVNQIAAIYMIPQHEIKAILEEDIKGRFLLERIDNL